MDYAELQTNRRESTVAVDTTAYNFERERIPILHSGFTTATKADAAKSVLQLHIYFSHGTYMVRIEDRQDNIQAFLEVSGLANLLEELEAAIVGDTIRWQEKRSSNGYAGR